MNLHGSFRSCSTKYTESLACTDGIARLREESWYLKSYCSTTNCRGIILSLISTKSTLKMIFIYFFLPKKNSMQIVSQDRSSLHSSILTKYFVKIMISSQKYARNSVHKFIKFLDNRTNTRTRGIFTLSSFSSTFIARYRKRLRAVVRVVSYSLRKSSR